MGHGPLIIFSCQRTSGSKGAGATAGAVLGCFGGRIRDSSFTLSCLWSEGTWVLEKKWWVIWGVGRGPGISNGLWEKSDT